jgi:hypothetical protein
MSKPLIRIHNVETDEIIDREMTESEYEKHLEEIAIHNAKQAEAEAKAQAKSDLLAKLGISEEEAQLLLS